MRSKAPPATAEESERIRLAKARGCIACLIEGLGLWCGPTEYNHNNVGGRVRAGHRHGYALGTWHHRGIVKDGVAHEQMRLRYGPSLAEGSKTFHARYGSDQALQDYQDRLLGLEPVLIARARRPHSPTARPAKMLPRRY